MLKNIVFDLGNVLVSFDPESILAHFVKEEEMRPLLRREVFNSIEWVMLDRGSISFDDAIRRIEAKLPSNLRTYVKDLILNWQESMIQFPESLDLLRDLKAAGVPLYLLSNISRQYRSYAHTIEAVAYMNDVFISSEHELIKPDPAIFLKAAGQFGIKPEESLFIDDVAANAEGAIRAGFSGLVYHGDIARLRRELFELDFPVTLSQTGRT